MDDLQLSPKPELDMKNEMHLYRSHIKIFADSMNIIRDSLFRQLNKDNTDTIIINKYIDSLVHFDRKMHQELVKHLTVVKSILDKEQYNIFFENMKDKFKPRCKPNNKKYKSYEKLMSILMMSIIVVGSYPLMAQKKFRKFNHLLLLHR